MGKSKETCGIDNNIAWPTWVDNLAHMRNVGRCKQDVTSPPSAAVGLILESLLDQLDASVWYLSHSHRNFFPADKLHEN